jgi:hypothetical protein
MTLSAGIPPDRFGTRTPDSKAHHERRVDVVARTIAVLIALGAFGSALLTGTAQPARIQLTSSGNCGPVLCIPLARGWSRSVGPGVAGGKPAAWLLAGNFPFPADAATREGTPPVPRGKVLISLGDFPVDSGSARWSRVARLRLPRFVGRVVSWHVRFSGRAVMLSVRFGSKPDAQIRRLANATLAAVHRDRP